jgi:hypothetical protein
MDHRQRVLAVVILTVLITLSVGFVTEYFRQSMTFSWTLEEGDEFIFEVKVTGNTTTDSQVSPPPFIDMNNTRINVEIISLPNVSIVFYAESFLEKIVEHLKTRTVFENGSEVPSEYRFIINKHISKCMLPIGGWRHLESFFSNKIENPLMEHESYISAHRKNSFYFGYSSYEIYEAEQWFGIIDLETGIPMIVSFWFFRTSQTRSYSYNLTMSLLM